MKPADALWIIGTVLLGASVVLDVAERVRTRRNWDRATLADVKAATDGASTLGE